MYDLSSFLDVWKQIQNYVTISLGVTTLVCGTGWYITDLKLDAANERVTAVENLRDADKANYEREQAEYTATALREKERIEQENRERAEEADRRYGTLLNEYNASIVRYSRRAVGSPVGNSDLPSPSGSTESGDGPGTSTVLPNYLTIPMEDAEICAENTARLQVLHDLATE